VWSSRTARGSTSTGKRTNETARSTQYQYGHHLGWPERRLRRRVAQPEDAKRYLQARCDFAGLYVTVTETTFIYTNGSEPGLSIGLINYPRFPVKSPAELEKTALEIAEQLMIILGQLRVTVVLSDQTITTESDRIAKAA
jgi:hypothetical protein